MKKKLNKFFHSIQFTWFLSSLSLLLIPLIASNFVLMKNKDILEQQKLEANNIILNTASSQSSFWFNDVQRITYNILYNSNILNSFGSHISAYDKLNIGSSLKTYIAGNNQISSISLISPSRNLVVASDTTADIETYVQALWQDGFLEDELWFRDFLKSCSETTGTYAALSYSRAYRLCYISRINNAYAAEPDLIMITLNSDYFAESLRRIIGRRNDFVIASLDGNVLLSVNGIVGHAEIDRDLALLSGKTVRINGKPYRRFMIGAELSDWKLIYYADNQDYTRSDRIITFIELIAMCLCLLVGIFIIIRQIRFAYKPINELMGLFKTDLSSEREKNMSEYSIITREIQNMISSYNSINKDLEKNMQLLQKNILDRLFKYSDNSEYITPEILEQGNIYFDENSYCIITFILGSLDNLFPSDRIDFAEKENLARIIIENVFCEGLEAIGNVYSHTIDKNIMLLLNFDEDESDSILRICREQKQAIEQYFSFEYTIVISSIYHDYAGIHYAYDEIIQAVKAPDTTNGEEILCLNGLTKNTSPSVKSSAQLYNLIEAGDSERCLELIRTTLNEALNEQTLPQALFDITLSLNKAAQTYGISDHSLYQKLYSLCSDDTLSDPKLASQTISEIISTLCSSVSGDNRIVNEVMNYVYNNYMNKDLNVNEISETFHLSPAYLSHIFKSETGMRLLYFINNVRITEAQKLLLNDKLSINDIAHDVGYDYRSSFSRIFTKYTGVSPQRWRNEHLPNA